MSVEAFPGAGPGPSAPSCRCRRRRSRCAATATGASAGATWGRSATSCMLCAARVQVGPVGQTFWAIWERAEGTLHERTKTIAPGSPGARSGPRATRAATRAGSTGRRRAAVPWSGSRRPPGPTASACAPSCTRARGRGSRRSARPGRTTTTSGRASGWSRSSATCGSASAGSGPRRAGSRTSPAAITRTHGLGLVGWRRRDPRRPGGRLEPGRRDQRPRAGLRARALGRRRPRRRAAAGALRWPRRDRGRRGAARVHAPRPSARKEQRRPFAYTYRQPFGSFAGTLPGGLELASGLGVMEHHEASW